MNEKKYIHSIYSKVRRKTLTAALISAFTIFLVATVAIFIIRANVAEVSGNLGEQASKDSVNGITQLAKTSLRNSSDAYASISDKQLKTISDAVHIVAAKATDVTQHPDEYRMQTILPPDPKNDGKLTPQLLLAPGTDQNDVIDEIGMLANLSNLQIAILKNSGDQGLLEIGTETGILTIVDAQSSLKTSDVDPRTRPWYTGAKKANDLVWTEVFDDAYGRGLAMTCAMPYYDKDGKIKGVVGAGAFLSSLSDTITEKEAIGTSEKFDKAFIVDDHGDIIISKDITKDIRGKIVQDNLLNSSDSNMRKAAAEMFERKAGIKRVTVGGEDYFMSYSPMSVLPWTFCVLIDVKDVLLVADVTEKHISNFTDEALYNIQHIFIVILIIFGLLLVMITLTEMRMSRKLAANITDPIVFLTDNVRNLKSHEDLIKNLHMETGDEVEELADAFTDMTLRLKNYIENLTAITAEKERIGTELEVATSIQTSMLPCIFPPFPYRGEFDMYAIMDPAKEVGGDFYDFFLIDDDTLCLVIADVSGKGVPAALYMVITKTLLKNNAQAGKDPAEVFGIVNNLLCENNDADMFVTAFMGYLDIPTGRFTFVNAGHNPPLIKQGDGFKQLPLHPDFVLAGMENTIFHEDEIKLSPGDALFMYTDGAVEAVNTNFELFSTERLTCAANSEDIGDLAAFVLNIKADIDDFALGVEQFDDITMLAFRYDGEDSKNGNGESSESSEDTPIFMELNIPAEVENLNPVLEFIAAPLQEKGCPESLIKQIEIASEEVFVNIARYAYPPIRGDAKILLSIGKEVTIIFSDEGKPFDPLGSKDPDISLSAEDRVIGGLGIFMTKKIMDYLSYSYEDGRNILTLKKTIG
jgi:sigma-B regulation protein RsbU (phosphoserine phosphatase)